MVACPHISMRPNTVDCCEVAAEFGHIPREGGCSQAGDSVEGMKNGPGTGAVLFWPCIFRAGPILRPVIVGVLQVILSFFPAQSNFLPAGKVNGLGECQRNQEQQQAEKRHVPFLLPIAPYSIIFFFYFLYIDNAMAFQALAGCRARCTVMNTPESIQRQPCG